MPNAISKHRLPVDLPIADTSTSCDYNGYCYNSTWDSWGRWAATAGIIVFFIVLFCLCSCFTARRRRRLGRMPMYGTGWAAGRRFGQPQQQYYPPQQENNPSTYYAYQQPPAPVASPPPPYPASQGYGQQGYGQYPYAARDQQTGIELESPAGAYAPPKVEPTNGMAGMPPRR